MLQANNINEQNGKYWQERGQKRDNEDDDSSDDLIS